jgi:ubiquinone/menaquinone biosynthesis C-methylase UbiE
MKFPDFKPEFLQKTPVLDQGVFVLPSISNIETTETEDSLDHALQKAKAEGWVAAAVELHGGEENAKYVTSSDRYHFLSKLPLKPDQAILEIGCSLGQIMLPIAKRVKTVDGLEVVLKQAQFAAERARQENIDNVRFAAGGTDCLLPYADAVFDGVVLNLVLEWCANRDSAMHEIMQQQLLNEIARVLKPGGFLFLNTKNRYAIRLLLGGHDEHMDNMRFGSVLPRWLGRLLMRNRKSFGWLHSYPHLKAMIEKAGFGKTTGLWAAPEMRWPTEILAFDSPELSEKLSKTGFPYANGRMQRRIMASLPPSMIKYITPGLTFMAYK